VRGKSDADIRFSDVLRLGFAERIKGDHHIFSGDECDRDSQLAASEIDGKTVPSETGT
jgi:hypothetical protein